MANHCLRQLAMKALPKDEMSVLILNPQNTESSEKCEFYRTDEPQVYVFYSAIANGLYGLYGSGRIMPAIHPA